MKKFFLLDVSSGVLLSGKPSDTSEEIAVKTLGSLKSVNRGQEGKRLCVVFGVSNGKTYLVDVVTETKFEEIRTYVQLINIKASQREARKQRRQILDLNALEENVKTKYGFAKIQPAQTFFNEEDLRKYKKPEYQVLLPSVALLELTERQESNEAAVVQTSSSPKQEGKYDNQDESKYSNDPEFTEKSKYVNEADQLADTHVKSKDGYQIISSVGASEEEKEEHLEKQSKKPSTKYNSQTWKDVGVPMLDDRKRMNDVGAQELFEPLANLCSTERSFIL